MKKLLFLLPLVLIIAAGCGLNEAITPESVGMWNTFIKFFARLILMSSDLFFNNFALGIITVTILIRTLMIPLYLKQMKSTEKMQEVKPEITKLSKKFPEHKNRQHADSKKYSQEMMAVYQKNGINPIAGCLPILFQLPIFIAFYQTIFRLVVGDGTTTGIQAFGYDHLSMDFLGFNMNEPSIFFALIAASLIYGTSHLTSKGQDNQMLNAMKYMMPLLILIIGVKVTAGLTIYWATSNLFTFGQTVYSKRNTIFNKDEITKAK